MSEKVWVGSIYLKDEGGYEIVLRALNHYSKRLTTIGLTPEIRDSSPMFIQILQEEGRKTQPKIKELINTIKEGLKNPNSLNQIQNEIPFLQKTLQCYKSDIQKCLQSKNQYYDTLLDNPAAKNDLPLIKTALEKINQFSD